MRNIIVGPAYPLRGGIANFNEALCRAFVQEGDTSEIYSFTLQYPEFLFPGTTQFETSDSGPADIKITPLLNSIQPFSWAEAANKIRHLKPDYIILRYWLPFMAPCLGTVARWATAFNKIKVIAITDNVVPHEKRPGDKMLTQYFVNSCDAFVAMSRSVLYDLEQFDHKKPKVFSPHPVYDIFGDKTDRNTALNKLELDPQFNYILFFGFIRKYKGLDLLLHSLAHEKLHQPNLKLIIAGEYYGDREYYENIIKELKLEDKIILHTRYIPREAVKYYFSACDMVVQPYKTATQSGVTQIAYHFDKPMLVTDVGGLAEMVPHGRVGYVTAAEPAEIAAGIHEFYAGKKEAEFVQGVMQEKHRFSWKAMVRAID
ncbi:MAG: glycosyltransferase, partial [Bacteroidia bacterium]